MEKSYFIFRLFFVHIRKRIHAVKKVLKLIRKREAYSRGKCINIFSIILFYKNLNTEGKKKRKQQTKKNIRITVSFVSIYLISKLYFRTFGILFTNFSFPFLDFIFSSIVNILSEITNNLSFTRMYLFERRQ